MFQNEYISNLLLRALEVVIPLVIVLFLIEKIGVVNYGLFAAQYVWYVAIIFITNLGFDVATADLLKTGFKLGFIIRASIFSRLAVSLVIFPLLVGFTDLSAWVSICIVIDGILNTRFILINTGQLKRLLYPTIALRLVQLLMVIKFYLYLDANWYVLSYSITSLFVSLYVWNSVVPKYLNDSLLKVIFFKHNIKKDHLKILYSYTPLHLYNYVLLRSHLLLGSLYLSSQVFAIIEIIDRAFSIIKFPLNAMAEVYLAKSVNNSESRELKKSHGLFVLFVLISCGLTLIYFWQPKEVSIMNLKFSVWFILVSFLLFAEWITNFFHLPILIKSGQRGWLLTSGTFSVLLMVALSAVYVQSSRDILILSIVFLPYFVLVILREFKLIV